MRFLVAVLFAAAAAAAQPFAAARPHGDDPLSPDSFTFAGGGRACTVEWNGRAICTRPGRRAWPFRLPVDDGAIIRLYFARYGHDLLIAYELDDGESGWSEVVRMNRGARRPAWKVFIGTFNLHPPELERRTISVTANGTLRARIGIDDGSRRAD